jgi:hypothetical protein
MRKRRPMWVEEFEAEPAISLTAENGAVILGTSRPRAYASGR